MNSQENLSHKNTYIFPKSLGVLAYFLASGHTKDLVGQPKSQHSDWNELQGRLVPARMEELRGWRGGGRLKVFELGSCIVWKEPEEGRSIQHMGEGVGSFPSQTEETID